MSEFMKRFFAILTVAALIPFSGFCRKTELPEWLLSPNKGEYTGLSLPGGGQEQAIAAALVAYIIGNDTKCAYQGNSESASFNGGSYFNSHAIFTCATTVKFDIVHSQLLESGEFAVSITSGTERSEIMRMDVESDISVKEDGNSTESVKFIFATYKLRWDVTITRENNDEPKISSSYFESAHPSEKMTRHYPASAEFDYAETKVEERGYIHQTARHPRIPLSMLILNSCTDILMTEIMSDISESSAVWSENGITDSKNVVEQRTATPVTGFSVGKETLYTHYTKNPEQ